METLIQVLVLIAITILTGWMAYDLVKTIKKLIERRRFKKDNNDEKDGCKNESEKNEHCE